MRRGAGGAGGPETVPRPQRERVTTAREEAQPQPEQRPAAAGSRRDSRVAAGAGTTGTRRRSDRYGRGTSHRRRSHSERRSLRSRLSVLALEDRAHRVAGLGDVRQVELRLGFRCGTGRSHAAAIAAEVSAHAVCLVFIDGAGMRLAGDADGLERIENRPALYFQFACQIVDSNFVHPSLLSSVPHAAQLVIQASFAVEVLLSLLSLKSAKLQQIPQFRSTKAASRPWLATVVPVRIDGLV